MKLYLFLRSLVWTSILAATFALAALVSAFIAKDLATPIALVAVTFAVLSVAGKE